MHALLLTFVTLPLLAQTTPAAGTPTPIPASARLLDTSGAPLTPVVATGAHEGFCALWAKQREAVDGLVSTAVGAIDLIDDATPATPATRSASVRELLPFVDVFNDTISGLHLPNFKMPWTTGCTAAGGDLGGIRFAVRLRGNLHVEAAGTRTFIAHSDDGYRLTIGGQTVMAYDANRAAAIDTRRATFAQPGVYPIEVVYWDQGGVAVLELFTAASAVCFNASGAQGACGAGAFTDRTLAAVTTTGFEILGSNRVGVASWAGAADTCASRVGQGNATCSPPAVVACGNGVVDVVSTGATEACDDGNTVAGDGCSPTCTVEGSYVCGPPQVSLCVPVAPVLTAPPNGGATASTQPVVSGTGAAGMTVTARVDGATVCTAVVPASGSWSCTPTAPLAQGPHTATATQADGAGRTSASSNANAFTVDSVAPAAPSITAPAQAAQLPTGRPTFTGAAEPGATVAVYVDGSATPACTALAAPDGTWSCLAAAPALSEGAHAATATATDPVGNASAPSPLRDFTVDTVAPAAPAITAPVQLSVTSNPTPTLAGTAEPGSTVRVLLDGASTPACVTTASPLGAWSCASPPLQDGAHAIVATATDAAGNASPPSPVRDFSVDATAPGAPVITSPAQGSATANPTPALSGTAEANSTVRVSLDGAPACTTTASASGAWSCASPVLADGLHSASATATDAAGNTSPATPARTFTVDTSTPAAPAITAPAQGASLADATPQVTGTADPGATVAVFVDGGPSPACTATANASGAWSCTVAPALGEGPHTLLATASNAAGTTSASLPRGFSVDTTAPAAPAIVAPAEGGTTPASPTVTGTGEPGATVRLFVDGAASPACTAVVDAAGNFTCVIAGPLAAGSHGLTAEQRDAAGNTSTASASRGFVVDPGSPPGPPVIAAPSRGAAVRDATPDVSGTATPGAEVRVYADGGAAPACVTTAAASGAWSCALSPALAEGPHQLTATATTPAGTSGPSLAVPFTVDTVAPGAPLLTAPAPGATTGATPLFAGSAEPGATVSVFVDGAATPACVATANASGAWACAPASPLPSGAHAVTASAVDAAGNQGPASGQSTFTVAPGQAPAAPAITTPVSGSFTSDTTPVIAGVAAPGEAVSVFLDGASAPACTATADATGHFSCAPTAALSEGPHAASATSTSAAGTSARSAAVPFTVDATAPATPVIGAPAPGALTGTTPLLSGTAEAGSTVSVWVDGQLLCEAVAGSGGAWSCPVTRPLAPGPHEVRAAATDAAGNRSPPAAPVTFTAVAAPAAPVLQQPAEGSTVSTATPAFTGLATPGAAVEVLVDGLSACQATADAMGHFSCTPAAPLAAGPHAATVRATTAGGVATSGPTGFSVNLAPPAPVLTAPAGGAVVATGRPALAGTAEPGSTVEVSVDGAVVCQAAVDALGRFSCTPSSPLSAGPHTATATASTAAGTSAPSAPVTFSVQAAPRIVSPADGGTTGPRPTFTGTAAPGAAVSVLVDGVEVCATTADASGAFSCSATAPLAGGAHSVVVRSGELEAAAIELLVTTQSLAGAGLGCSSAGASPAAWLLLAAAALLLRRSRALEHHTGSRASRGERASRWGGQAHACAPHRARQHSAGARRSRARLAVSFAALRPGNLFCALAAVAALGVAGPALAQATAVPAFELERTRLNPAAGHSLLIDAADMLPKFQYRAALTFHYQKDPLVLMQDGVRVGAVVGDRIGLHVSGAFAITDWLEVAAQVPVILSQSGADLSGQGLSPVYGGVAAGTPLLAVRGALVQQRRDGPLDLTLGLALGLPIGSAEALAKDGSVTFIPTVAAGRTLGSFLRLGGSVSVVIRNAQTLTAAAKVVDEVGTVVAPALVLSTLGDGLRGELSARFDLPVTRAPIGAELDLGLRYPLFDLLELYAVGGPGFGAMPGMPSFRVLAGVALAPRPKAVQTCVAGQPHRPSDCPGLDLDGDGVVNADDRCPETLGIAARAGCPDQDSDHDGVLDSEDACADRSGTAARRGCPEPDADGDGLPDERDGCPTLAGPAALAGCPDTDGDGFTDPVDACPKELGVAELKGCPDTDADGDGVVDRLDACRAVPGTRENGGCPKDQRQLVLITRERLVIEDKVSFATGQSKVLPRSLELLRQIARVLAEHPEVERVSIEGHTDARGDHDANVRLSQARAEAVRALLSKAGVPDARMTARGFGPDRPLASNGTDKGREANRRVDFVIVGAETTRPGGP